jgi:hypothetical protein
MRTYTIDQLEEDNIAAINSRLLDLDLQAGLEGVYWLPVPKDMLTAVQTEHFEHCGPYCLALDVETNAVHLELLVRGMGRISCECLAFASEKLRNHMIAYLEGMLQELHITF